MKEQKLLSIINIVLLKKSKKAIHRINSKLRLQSDLGFDSLDLAELTVRIEDEFGVDVFKKGIISTVGEILDQL